MSTKRALVLGLMLSSVLVAPASARRNLDRDLRVDPAMSRFEASMVGATVGGGGTPLPEVVDGSGYYGVGSSSGGPSGGLPNRN